MGSFVCTGLLVLIVLVVVLLWLASFYNSIIPLKQEVKLTKAGLISCQRNAEILLEKFSQNLMIYRAYEEPILKQYLGTVENSLRSGASGKGLATMIVKIAPPKSELAGLFRDFGDRMAELHFAFSGKLEAYHRAVADLNNQLETFPANLANPQFFNIAPALYLEASEESLLPPTTMIRHAADVRRVIEMK